MVECRTPEREVGGSIPTAAVLCPWARHFTPRKYWLITQEAVAPSRHDWKIVDWDVKPQHKQTNKFLASRFYYVVIPCSLVHSSIFRGTGKAPYRYVYHKPYLGHFGEVYFSPVFLFIFWINLHHIVLKSSYNVCHLWSEIMSSSMSLDCLGSEGVHIFAINLLQGPTTLSFSCFQERECPTFSLDVFSIFLASWNHRKILIHDDGKDIMTRPCYTYGKIKTS